MVKSADGSHGLIELTWGAPTASRSKLADNGLTITGTDGWITIKQVDGIFEIKIFKQLKSERDGKVVGEEEEVIEVPAHPNGIEKEIAGFLAAVNGSDDGLGNPREVLRDVAFIQAALNSNGSPIDLDALCQE